MSFMTVGHAYQMLESQGRIVARPQSGYYVAARPTTHQSAPPAQVMRDEVVDINTYIFDVLQASRDPSVVPLPRRFPIRAFSRFSNSTDRWLTSAKRLPP